MVREADLGRGNWLLYKLLPPAANPWWCAAVLYGGEAVLALVESRAVLMQATDAMDAVLATESFDAVGGVKVFAALLFPACHVCILLVCDSRSAAAAIISAGKWARPGVCSFYRLIISVRVFAQVCP